MWKPGQLKWFGSRRYRIEKAGEHICTKKDICSLCRLSCDWNAPCELKFHPDCIRQLPADCYFKLEPRTPELKCSE